MGNTVTSVHSIEHGRQYRVSKKRKGAGRIVSISMEDTSKEMKT